MNNEILKCALGMGIQVTYIDASKLSDEQFEQQQCEQDYYNEQQEEDDMRSIGYDTLTGEEVDLDPRGYCVHGVYVGGCGADYMCGHCEMGDFNYGTYEAGVVVISGRNPSGEMFTSREPMRHIKRAEQSAENWIGILKDVVPDLSVTIERSSVGYWFNEKDGD